MDSDARSRLTMLDKFFENPDRKMTSRQNIPTFRTNNDHPMYTKEFGENINIQSARCIGMSTGKKLRNGRKRERNNEKQSLNCNNNVNHRQDQVDRLVLEHPRQLTALNRTCQTKLWSYTVESKE